MHIDVKLRSPLQQNFLAWQVTCVAYAYIYCVLYIDVNDYVISCDVL